MQSCQCRVEQQYLMLNKAAFHDKYIVFITEVMIMRQRDDYHALTSYFY